MKIFVSGSLNRQNVLSMQAPSEKTKVLPQKALACCADPMGARMGLNSSVLRNVERLSLLKMRIFMGNYFLKEYKEAMRDVENSVLPFNEDATCLEHLHC